MEQAGRYMFNNNKTSASGSVPKMPFRFIFSSRTYLLEISIEKEKLENTLCSSMPISLDGGYLKIQENGSIIQHPSSSSSSAAMPLMPSGYKLLLLSKAVNFLRTNPISEPNDCLTEVKEKVYQDRSTNFMCSTAALMYK